VRDVNVRLHAELRLSGHAAELVTTRTYDAGRPDFLVKAAIVSGSETREGTLIESVGLAWWKILDVLNRDRNAAYELTARQWEEIFAGAYEQLGFDEVILTPASGDHGRDVIATKSGVGSIRIYDQVKAYKPGHRVPANDVRAMLGVLSGQNVSKGIITTTSEFAPRLMEDPAIAQHVPFRLELKDRDKLFPWLDSLRK
jgi:restriction system protein